MKNDLSGVRKNCEWAIQHAFSHYLYQMTHTEGGRLIHCWVNASYRKHSTQYGAHEPSSPEELSAMMCYISSYWPLQNSVNRTYLQQAQNVSNALVLDSRELRTIAEEFLASVNLDSLCQAFGQGHQDRKHQSKKGN